MTGQVRISEQNTLTRDDTEFVPVIQSDGGLGWVSGKLPITDFGGANLANTDLTQTANRTYDIDGFRISFINGQDITHETNIAPSGGNASHNSNGYGTLSTDVTHRFTSDLGTTLEMYGDRGIYALGTIGIGVSPATTRRLYISDSGSNTGAYIQANTGKGIIALSTSNYGGDFNGTYGVVAVGTSGAGGDFTGSSYGAVGQGAVGGVYGRTTSTGYGVIADGSGGLRALRTDGQNKHDNVQVGNAGLVAGEAYKDTAANILANGDYIYAIKA